MRWEDQENMTYPFGEMSGFGIFGIEDWVKNNDGHFNATSGDQAWHYGSIHKDGMGHGLCYFGSGWGNMEGGG